MSQLQNLSPRKNTQLTREHDRFSCVLHTHRGNYAFHTAFLAACHTGALHNNEIRLLCTVVAMASSTMLGVVAVLAMIGLATAQGSAADDLITDLPDLPSPAPFKQYAGYITVRAKRACPPQRVVAGTRVTYYASCCARWMSRMAVSCSTGCRRAPATQIRTRWVSPQRCVCRTPLPWF